MDARKGPGHLSSLVSRLREEATRNDSRVMLKGGRPEDAILRRRRFLDRIAACLSRPLDASGAVPALS